MPYLYEYPAVRSHLLIKIDVDEYRTTASGAYSAQTLTFSDLNRGNNIVYQGNTYTGLGKLLAVTASASEIKPSSSELTITLSGIPTNSISEILNSKIKGCPVWIYRILLDPVTGVSLPFDENPWARFRGFVNNYSLQEDYDAVNRVSRNTLLLICKSSLDVMQNKISGRLTNPVSWRSFYPNDPSMDRVPTLQNASFNFGAPK